MTEVLNREVVAMFFKDSSNRVRLNNLVVLQEVKSNHDGESYVIRQYWDVDYSRQFGYIFHESGSGGDETIEVTGIYHVSATAIVKRLLGEPLGALKTPQIVEKESQWVDARLRINRTQEISKRNRTRRIFRLPKAINLCEGEDLLDWLQTNGIEGNSVWCSTCKDCFPGYDGLCEHCWWCDKTGDYSTPSERCRCKSREECSGEE